MITATRYSSAGCTYREMFMFSEVGTCRPGRHIPYLFIFHHKHNVQAPCHATRHDKRWAYEARWAWLPCVTTNDVIPVTAQRRRRRESLTPVLRLSPAAVARPGRVLTRLRLRVRLGLGGGLERCRAAAGYLAEYRACCGTRYYPAGYRGLRRRL